MKFDAACATNWNEKNPNVAHIHTGDASSEDDLARVVAETGSSHDFDVIMDDASHINWHMIKTLEILIEQIQMGGMYFVEDILSSYESWSANMGSHNGEQTGGTQDCMTPRTRGPTFLAKMFD